MYKRQVKDFNKYKDFFEFSEPIKNIKEAKNSHRFLAMRRGMSQKVLKVSTSIDSDAAYKIIEGEFFDSSKNIANRGFLQKVAKKAFDISISTSMDLEMKTEVKKLADDAAINVFKVNLKNLLLQPYLGSKAVLGIDPGIRTGCKVVIIDDTGKFVGDHVIYPFAPKFDTNGSKIILEKMIEMFKISYIAIGNGTNGRETLEFVQDNIKAVQDGEIKAVMINESGASIYSASDIAREEFPDKDVTVRGSISIARRFQDPLAELVKIDPKSIGVGQYQHDVSQTKLKKSLSGVVEDCVNFVGVDLNTASAPLLSYISGVGPTLAKNIVKFREKNKGFKDRRDLLKVSRFSEKIFEQSAGFLRIYSGSNPLDGTFIHPERYSSIENWCKTKSIEITSLINDRSLVDQMLTDSSLKNDIGELTLKDIVDALRSPKQDPRNEFKPTEFRKDVRKITDLKVGQWYTGLVNNITNFGAFVDLGVKESGLLHVSQISDEFVSNPMDKLKVGQELKVRVTELDLERKRIGLSAKSEDGVNIASNHQGSKSGKKKQHKESGFKNNAFAGLANFKLK